MEHLARRPQRQCDRLSRAWSCDARLTDALLLRADGRDHKLTAVSDTSLVIKAQVGDVVLRTPYTGHGVADRPLATLVSAGRRTTA